MSGTSIALIFISILFFVCFAAGSTILSMLKIQKNQISSKLIIGFFSLFSFISMIVFVLNLFGSLLPMQVYVYLLWVSILLFALIPVIFVKYWFKSFKLNWNSLILLVVFIGYFLLFYFLLKFNTSNTKGISFKLFMIKNLMDGWEIGDSKFKGIFDQIMLAPLIIYNFSNPNVMGQQNGMVYVQYIFMFNVFIRSIMFTALTAMIFETGIGATTVSKIVINIIVALSIFGFIFLTSNMSKSVNESTMFIYLVELITTMVIFYCTNQNRYKMYTYLTGILAVAAIGMEPKKIIILLFFIYAILLILSFSFDNMLFKDHIKILFPVSLGALLYSFSIGNFIWIMVSAAMIIVTFVIVIWIFTSHLLIKKMEFTLSSRSSILMIIVPIILIVFGALTFLGVSDWTGDAVGDKFSYLLKYELIALITDPLIRLPILISITVLELVICFLWVSRRKKFKNKFSVILIDFVVIQYLMFYNPFSRIFWLIILKTESQIPNDLFHLFYVFLAFAILIWLLEYGEKYIMKLLNIKLNKEEEIKIISYKNIFKRNGDRLNEWKNKTKDRRSKKPDKRLEP